MGRNFRSAYETREVLAPVSAASNTDENSDRIDMSGYDEVTFIVPITDSAATGVATLTVEQNTADSDTSMAALSGASDTATSVTNDDLNGHFLQVTVVKPIERYVQAVVTSGTANIAFGNMIAILRRKKQPGSAHSTAAGTPALVASPAEA